jgi:PST family polysaccharide transporter/O-antigen flippase
VRARIGQALSPQHLFGLMARSFITLATGEGLARAIGVVTTILLVRRLNPGGFGLVSLGIALVGWFRLVVDSGTESLNVREISRRPDRFREITDPVLGLRLILSVVAAALFVIGGYALTTAPTSRTVLLRFALVLPAVAINLRWMVLGIRQARAVAIGNVASRLAVLIGVLAVVTHPHDTGRVPFLEAIAEATYAMVIIVIVARSFGFVRPRIDIAKWKATLKESSPLFIYGACRATILTVDLFLIQLILGPLRVGWYGAGIRPGVFFLGAMGLFSVSFLSAFSAAHDREAFTLFRRTARLTTGSMTVVAAIVAATSSVVVPLIYGDRYDPSIAVLAIFVWTLPLAALDVNYASALIARERQGLLMGNNIVGALFAVGACAAVIPWLGIDGAAGVRVATYALVLGLNHRSCVRNHLAPSVLAVLGRGAPAPQLERSSA